MDGNEFEDRRSMHGML